MNLKGKKASTIKYKQKYLQVIYLNDVHDHPNKAQGLTAKRL